MFSSNDTMNVHEPEAPNTFKISSRRLLFESLVALLPLRPSDASHPSVALWRRSWPLFEEVMARPGEQPLRAAAQALRQAALSAPVLLAEVLRLIAGTQQEVCVLLEVGSWKVHVAVEKKG